MKDKKFIIIPLIGIIVAFLFSFGYSYFTGKTYDYHSNKYLGEAKVSNCTMYVDKEGVVKLENTYLSDTGELIFTVSSVGEGRVDSTFSYMVEYSDGNRHISSSRAIFEVNSLGIIFDKTRGLNFSGFAAVIVSILMMLLLAEAMMVLLFIKYWKRGDFSYPMISCGGLGIFFFVLFIFLIYKIVNNVVYSMSDFLYLFSETGTMVLLAISPIMLVFSILLSLSNIWLMRHEGRRPVNALGIIFGILWFIGIAVTLNVLEFLWKIPYYSTIHRILVYIITYFECMFISTVVCSFLATRYKIPHSCDYIIILGCAIRDDGTLTPLLKARVDSAVEFEKKQFEATGKHAVFVPSGGQGADEVISEGEAMENYLKSIGIPAEQIAREDKSTNTYENMKFSKEVIDRHSGGSKDINIAFSTTNYHVFRGYILSKKNGFEAKGISAKTKPYFYLNAFLREFIGLLVDQKFKHALFILLTVAASMVYLF